MCEVNFIQQFDLIMEYCRENFVHSREQLLMLTLFHCANRMAQKSTNHSWPDDFFPVSNAEITAWSNIDKKSIETLRNSLKQRGLIDFTKGCRNKSQPTYKIHYLVRVGYRIVPNNTSNNNPNSTTNNNTNSTTNQLPNSTPLTININTKVNPNVNNTHTSSQQEVPSRACDPIAPDDAWKQSDRVRCAVAQRLVDRHMGRMMEGAYVCPDETVLNDSDAVDVFCFAMKKGVTPDMIESLAEESC